MIHDGRSRKLPFDPVKAVEHLKGSDPKLAMLIERAGPFTLRLDHTTSPFESLLESILYQQLHGKAAATIHRRVREYFGGDPTPQLLLDTPDEPLRAAGVSGNKIKALRDLAARTIDGTVLGVSLRPGASGTGRRARRPAWLRLRRPCTCGRQRSVT